MTIAKRLAALGTATLGEAAPDTRILDEHQRPITEGVHVAGPARTVRYAPGDNLALHLSIERAQAGEVIVVDYGGNTQTGPFGEIMALACQIRGIAGLVTNGAVRDSA